MVRPPMKLRDILTQDQLTEIMTVLESPVSDAAARTAILAVLRLDAPRLRRRGILPGVVAAEALKLRKR